MFILVISFPRYTAFTHPKPTLYPSLPHYPLQSRQNNLTRITMQTSANAQIQQKAGN
jgi:hypothetical protein